MVNHRSPIPGDDHLNFVRARLVLRTLERLHEWNKDAMESIRYSKINFAGKFDFGNVGLAGRSRGGKGVRVAYNILMEGNGLLSDVKRRKPRLSNVNVRAVLEITPMFSGQGKLYWALTMFRGRF
ncbi:hypothetical protein K493DRAFT_305940 [Basidiobolus meristosporus CBS 931.73]|uniref:Uncharacterized protein n=1 Tax=Basidiobolus meristosporus CBS 931.73 TaxID=1314790 RepID=A0A1Y1XTZ6_9FUNG|nr:hypothetical protein K493DRAFT_305940 [Basidiobolus meristosporus CBS 931.73]|eukprot:ORX89218.1 hypothetical protein K493DRAFT_305940 [Basidiobolus meristosporus CBS 931.73]